MSETEIIAIYALGYVMGTVYGYITWAPMTNFKRGFLNGVSLGLWKDHK